MYVLPQRLLYSAWIRTGAGGLHSWHSCVNISLLSKNYKGLFMSDLCHSVEKLPQISRVLLFQAKNWPFENTYTFLPLFRGLCLGSLHGAHAFWRAGVFPLLSHVPSVSYNRSVTLRKIWLSDHHLWLFVMTVREYFWISNYGKPGMNRLLHWKGP